MIKIKNVVLICVVLIFVACKNVIKVENHQSLFKSNKIEKISIYCHCLRFGDDTDFTKNVPCQSFFNIKNSDLIVGANYKYTLKRGEKTDSLFDYLANYSEIIDTDTIDVHGNLTLALILENDQKFDTINFISPNYLLLNDRYLLKYKADTRLKIINAIGDSIRSICF